MGCVRSQVRILSPRQDNSMVCRTCLQDSRSYPRAVTNFFTPHLTIYFTSSKDIKTRLNTTMLAKFIQDQRKKNNLTQEYMASKLGISRPTYAQIEKGERDLTIPEAQRLVELFDTTLENF